MARVHGTLLVTGASGYLGREIVRQAIAKRPFQTVWATRYSQRLQFPGARPVYLDVTSAGSVLQLVADVLPQVIIHAAYNKREDMLEPVTVLGTQHIAQAASAIGARLVHISTDLVFDGEGGPYDESASPAPIHAYGRAKAAAEEAVRQLAPNSLIVRTSLICGLDPVDPATAWILTSLRDRQPITLFTDELRTPVWVQDLAAALLEQASGELTGILHVAGPQSLSRFDMGVRLARHFGLDPAGITPGLSRESGLVRPRDCRLNTTLAQQVLETRLRSFDEGLEAHVR